MVRQIALLIFMVAPTFAMAQECPIVNYKDKLESSSSFEASLHILNIIDKENYKKFSQGANLNVFYEGIDLGADYDEMQENRTELYKKFEFDYEQSSSQDIVKSYLTGDGLDAYLACIKQNSAGLRVEIKSADALELVILLSYDKIAQSSPSSVNYLLKAEGGETSDIHDMSGVIDDKESLALTFKRSDETAFFISLEGSDVTVPYLRIPTPYSLPPGLVAIVAKITQNGAPPKSYVNTYPVPLHGKYRAELTGGSHSGWFNYYIEIVPNRSYQARVGWMRGPGTFHINKVNHWFDGEIQIQGGKSKASMVGCGTPRPCDYHISARQITK